MKETNSIIKVLIADDHPLFLRGLKSFLQQNPEFDILGTALDGREAMNMVNENVPDVLVTDLNMPYMDGIELTKEVNRVAPKTRILAITSFSEPRYISTALKNGVNGYILKNAEDEEIEEAIRKVFKGETYISEEAQKIYMESLMPQQMSDKTESGLPSLSPREREILQLIADEFTMDEIAKQLFISKNTVITHRKRLLFKLDSKNTAGLIKRAMESGLLN